VNLSNILLQRSPSFRSTFSVRNKK